MGHSKSEQKLLRGCTNKDVRKLLAIVFSSNLRYRPTKNGIVVYGHDRTSKPIVIHMTVSDHRAHLNLRRDLRAIGLNTEGQK